MKELMSNNTIIHIKTANNHLLHDDIMMKYSLIKQPMKDWSIRLKIMTYLPLHFPFSQDPSYTASLCVALEEKACLPCLVRLGGTWKKR